MVLIMHCLAWDKARRSAEQQNLVPIPLGGWAGMRAPESVIAMVPVPIPYRPRPVLRFLHSARLGTAAQGTLYLEEMAFKVSLESLHSTKIKEISYDGEETIQERPSLSQKLTELAGRVDFSQREDGEEGESEPAAKKSTQKWPWEYTHSKLKQALMEVNVLSDVLQILHSHRNYIALDPIATQSSPPSSSSSYQYTVKKKALGVAATVLRKGTGSLSRISSHGEREFHQALSTLRQRWKLRRTLSGAIVGDLSYHSAGSQYPAVTFGVQKGERIDSSDRGEVIRVLLPQELRGRSEIVVFLSDQPVSEVSSLELLKPSPMDELETRYNMLPSWERQLVAAQNVLFNQELFSQLAREAYDQKDYLQYKVFSNKVIIPLGSGYWLSVLHIREYEQEKSKAKPPSSNLPSPRWELVVALKQLLRDNHHHRATLLVPRPSSAGFMESPELREAGVSAFTSGKIKEALYSENIFEKFMQKAKHLYNEERLQQCLSELCSSSSDPLLSVSWAPALSFTSTTAYLKLTNPNTNAMSYSLPLCLNVDTLTVQQSDGSVLALPVDTGKVMRVLRHQIVVYQMSLARQIAETSNWKVLQQFSNPPLSLTLAKSPSDYEEACSIVIMSPDAHRKLDVLLEWRRVMVSMTLYAGDVTSTNDIISISPKSRTFSLSSQPGQNFQQKFTNMLMSPVTAQPGGTL